MRDCHARNVHHGDIKTENILVTSWNWLYLTDFSSAFKKTYLPEDNPADFSYFFDISGRRTCYLAPERFLSAGEADDGRGVTWAMDIFSAGCVIAELFVESPIFSLSQLFKYRQGEYDPTFSHLNRIEDREIREVVAHMIQIEPEARYSAEEYLNFWRRKAFPEYFYSFLHQYMGAITDPSSGRRPVLPETANFGEADDRIDRVYSDFDKISYFLGYEDGKDSLQSPGRATRNVLPVEVDLPNNRHMVSKARRPTSDDGTLIFLTLVLSALRNTARAVSRVRACDLMLAFGERITDESKLDRILPYLVALLNDRSDLVKMSALRTVTQLLALVEVVSPVNAYVFTEYIRPRLTNLVQGSATSVNPAIRATYASCLASLAHTSLRILDMIQALRADGSIPTFDPEAENSSSTNAAYQNLYDVGRAELLEHFEAHTKALLEDSDASVRRALLGSVSSLCVFFGPTRAKEVVLSHLNTYLNDRDWMLKCAFFETVVGVATYVGSTSLEKFILPLMQQSLTDPEEFVVERVLRSFASMAELGLLQRSTSWELLDVVARFTIHPNIWIREAAVHFVSASTKYLSKADVQCIILPLVRPYLRFDIAEFEETSILDALKRPLPRQILEMAGTWFQKAETGLFWKPVPQHQTFTFEGIERAAPTVSSKDLTLAFQKLPKNKEDDQWLERLRNLGMASEDEIKLLALRDYIRRTVLRRSRDDTLPDYSLLSNIINLAELDATPQTVFFESRKKPAEPGKTRPAASQRQHSITDALLDASTTADDSLAIRKRSLANNLLRQRAGREGLHVLDTASLSRRTSSNLSTSPTSSARTRESSIDQAAIKQAFKAGVANGSGGETPSNGSTIPVESVDGQKVRVKHQTSAMTLINRRNTPKTSAATGTDATNAVGEMDGPFTPDGAVNSPRGPTSLHQPTRAATSEIHTGHTYLGSDPNVKGLLDSLASEKYRVDEFDFGPLVTPVHRKRSRLQDSSEPEVPWRPLGIHVATFGEHEAPINRVLPSPDHMFFITASDDGTVRIWDTMRLERNLVHKSRQIHKHTEGAEVKCVAFVENTHAFVSCATDGSVNVVKVECVQGADAVKYSRLRIKRTYKLPGDEYATWCEHFRNDGRSLLLLATSASRIVALDLRTMSTAWELSNELKYGIPTCFCIDRKRYWLLLGTSRGILTLFDLRFRLAVRSWGLSGSTPIQRAFTYPSKGKGKLVCIVGGTSDADISVWDLDKLQCREVFRALSITDGSQRPKAAKELIKAFQPVPVSELVDGPSKSEPGSGAGVRAAVAGTDAGLDERESRYGYIVAGGADRKVRFWDLAHIETSATVSGLGVDEVQPRVSVAHPTPGLTVNAELPGLRPEEAAKREREHSRAKVSRTVQIAKEQKALLRGHVDTVTDVAILEGSTTMVVSTDRKGCIYVFE